MKALHSSKPEYLYICMYSFLSRVAKCWYCETGGVMRQHKFCPDKQQYNNAKPFPVCVVAIEEVKTIMNASNVVHGHRICT